MKHTLSENVLHSYKKALLTKEGWQKSINYFSEDCDPQLQMDAIHTNGFCSTKITATNRASIATTEESAICTRVYVNDMDFL